MAEHPVTGFWFGAHPQTWVRRIDTLYESISHVKSRELSTDRWGSFVTLALERQNATPSKFACSCASRFAPVGPSTAVVLAENVVVTRTLLLSACRIWISPLGGAPAVR